MIERVLLLCLLASGCEARLELGSRCARDGECPAPYACLLGSCRVECLSDADCPAGVHCVPIGEAGACTFASEERCTSGICPAPLACVESTCRAPCTLDSDCLAGQRCLAASCRSPEPLDGGVPDAGSFFSPARPCASALECETGEICASDTAPSVCRVACSDHGDCLGSACDWFVADTDAGYVEGCATVCQPGTSVGCPAGLTCRMQIRNTDVRPTGPPNVTSCQAVTDGAAHGCPCDYLLTGQDCAAGLSCEEPPEGRMCLQICVVGEPCPTGGTCVATMRSVVCDGRNYGVCPPPAAAPAGCP